MIAAITRAGDGAMHEPRTKRGEQTNAKPFTATESVFAEQGCRAASDERIVDGYREGLTRAKASGEIGDIDPGVAAWALMGVGEMIGMRSVLWPTGDSRAFGSGATPVPEHVFDEMVAFVQRALGTAEPQTPTTTSSAATAAPSKEDS